MVLLPDTNLPIVVALSIMLRRTRHQATLLQIMLPNTTILHLMVLHHTDLPQDTIHQTMEAHVTSPTAPAAPMATTIPIIPLDSRQVVRAVLPLSTNQTCTHIRMVQTMILAARLFLIPQIAHTTTLSSMAMVINIRALLHPTSALFQLPSSTQPCQILTILLLTHRRLRAMRNPRIARPLQFLLDPLLLSTNRLRFSSKFRAASRFAHGHSSILFLSNAGSLLNFCCEVAPMHFSSTTVFIVSVVMFLNFLCRQDGEILPYLLRYRFAISL
jgi:hypothetical protein